MPESFEIKTADPSDAADLLRLTGCLSHESKTVTIDPNWSKIPVLKEQKQIDLINHTLGNVIIIIKRGDHAIGLVTVQQIKSGVGELGVAVEKRFWNLGLGTSLVQEAIRWLNTYSNLKTLMLTVENRNYAAIHVYKKCGFQIVRSFKLKSNGVLATQMKIDRKKSD